MCLTSFSDTFANMQYYKNKIFCIIFYVSIYACKIIIEKKNYYHILIYNNVFK